MALKFVALIPAAVAFAAAVTPSGPIAFEDVTGNADVHVTLLNSAAGRKHMIETMTGGVAIVDVDADGRPDVYLVNGAAIPSLRKEGPQHWNRLYRQLPGGRFDDATERAGVAGQGYGMGVAAADYDNDGFPDLFLPGLNHSTLYRNRGDGTFEDATARAGLGAEAFQRRWSVAAAWLDYDRDGWLDLFVVNYLEWSPETDRICPNPTAGYRIYCDPKYFKGLPNTLFRNNGDGTFTDVSAETGIAASVGKGMSAAISDYDGDGWTDVFVANDTVPNFLFRNEHGRFREVGLAAGVSVNDSGRPVSSMGIDARDYDNDGRDDLFITALATQTFPLWRNLGNGFLADVTHASGVGRATVARSGWSAAILDLDNDGFKDLFAAAGDVQDNTEVYSSRPSRQSNRVLRNTGSGAFVDVSESAGPALAIRGLHRGAAFGDLDGDGRLDAVVTRLNEPVTLLRNVSPGNAHWLRVRLIGGRSNRDGIGARIAVTTASGRRQWNHATTAVGYASASEPIVHFGLGKEALARRVEIHWPSGSTQILENVTAGQVLTVTEEEPRR